MSEEHAKADPRWGQIDRDKKAEAIMCTVLQFAGRDISHGIWLDIGCGSGGVAATLAKHVKRVIGVDPESWERWSQLCHTHSNLVLHKGSYRDLDALLPLGSVDVVICNQVYEHVDDPAALLRAIHALLKPHGVCYFAGPNWLWPIEPHLNWPIAHWLPRTWVMYVIHRFKLTWARKWDARPWSFWSLAGAFRREGFFYASVIHQRLYADAQSRSQRGLIHLIVKMPRRLVNMLTPVAPGFVFMLVKK